MPEKVDLEMEMDYEPEIEYVLDDGTPEEVVEETLQVEETPKSDAATELEAIKAQLAALQGAVVQPTKSSNQELVEALRQLTSEKGSNKTEPDYSQFKQKFFTDPVENVREITKIESQETKALIADMQRNQAKLVEKMTVLANDSTRGFYNKYSDEIEAFVDKGETYEKALKLVKSDHMEDLVKDAVAAALAEAQKPAPEIPFTNSNVVPTAKPGKKLVKLNAQQLAVIKKIEKDNGGFITFEDAAEYARDNNLI